jgi:hypothetical protein
LARRAGFGVLVRLGAPPPAPPRTPSGQKRSTRGEQQRRRISDGSVRRKEAPSPEPPPPAPRERGSRSAWWIVRRAAPGCPPGRLKPRSWTQQRPRVGAYRYSSGGFIRSGGHEAAPIGCTANPARAPPPAPPRANSRTERGELHRRPRPRAGEVPPSVWGDFPQLLRRIHPLSPPCGPHRTDPRSGAASQQYREAFSRCCGDFSRSTSFGVADPHADP